MSTIAKLASVDGAASRSALRMRLRSFLTRARAGAPSCSVAIISEGESQPLHVLELSSAAPTDELTDELLSVMLEDSSLSGATSYRVVIQNADGSSEVTTILRVAPAKDHRHPMDANLRTVGESAEAALTRQLMRHLEATQRLMVESSERRSQAEIRAFERMADRLELIESKRDAIEARNVEAIREEARLDLERMTEERKQQRIDQALKQLMPALPRLLASVARATVGGAEPESTNRPEVQPVKAAPAITGGQTAQADDARTVLAVFASMPPDARETMLDFLEATQPAEAKLLREVHTRLVGLERKDPPT
jgi:hypothetical protein